MSFATWPPNRVRLCFDVTDLNFQALFSEQPLGVNKRCRRLHDRLTANTDLVYLGEEVHGGELKINCEHSPWTTYTGFEDYDYILPSGEVSCLPTSVDGELVVDGWVVGTIPFGLKYGRIHRGELRLSLHQGRVTTVTGHNQALCADLDRVLSLEPGLQVVVEAGLGQSKAVSAAANWHDVGYLWHERNFGLHLGLGAELPESADPAERKTSHHLDVVLSSGRLVDPRGKEILSWRGSSETADKTRNLEHQIG